MVDCAFVRVPTACHPSLSDSSDSLEGQLIGRWDGCSRRRKVSRKVDAHTFTGIKFANVGKTSPVFTEGGVFGHSDDPPCPCVETTCLPTIGDRWLRLPRPGRRQRWHGALGGFQGANEKSSWVFPRGEDEVRAEIGLGFLQIAEEGHLASSKETP